MQKQGPERYSTRSMLAKSKNTALSIFFFLPTLALLLFFLLPLLPILLPSLMILSGNLGLTYSSPTALPETPNHPCSGPHWVGQEQDTLLFRYRLAAAPKAPPPRLSSLKCQLTGVRIAGPN